MLFPVKNGILEGKLVNAKTQFLSLREYDKFVLEPNMNNCNLK